VSGCAPSRQGHGLRQPVRILLRQKGSRCSGTRASTAPSWSAAPQTRCWLSAPSPSPTASCCVSAWRTFCRIPSARRSARPWSRRREFDGISWTKASLCSD
jgi:hypothetical protein